MTRVDNKRLGDLTAEVGLKLTTLDRHLAHATRSWPSELRGAALPEQAALPLERASDGSDSS
jgi:hypothetical protein